MTNLTDLKEWQALGKHHKTIATQHMRDWFAQDPERFNRYSLHACDILLDYSRNLINSHTLDLLFSLAKATHLKSKIEAQFSGASINTTENRAVLHTALRDLTPGTLEINGVNVKQDIADALQRLEKFVDQIHQQKWLGVTGKPIKTIVNIGIGGSYMGPKMCVTALKDFAVSKLSFHFISSIDKTQLETIFQQINPEETLFIISSKSFNTIETLTNANTIMHRLKTQWGDAAIKHHFVAVTAAKQKAMALGIPSDQIFPVWDWVGGRYSIWSAIGLPLMLQIGPHRFREFLSGGFEMDQHFKTADFTQNMPVILALLGIWYRNFFDANVSAIIPYDHSLRYLIAYLQQADMESNGKSVDRNGKSPAYGTGPVLFGEEGVIGQHAYHQLLHQGTHYIPADFILSGKSDPDDHHQAVLVASALSQAQALMAGKSWSCARAELMAKNYSEQAAADLAHHQVIPGNKPSNIIFLNRLTPKTLGSLIAIYEHKIFVQGVIWDINSFDQWGVELGKQLLPEILHYLQDKSVPGNLDSSTIELLNQIYPNKCQ